MGMWFSPGFVVFFFSAVKLRFFSPLHFVIIIITFCCKSLYGEEGGKDEWVRQGKDFFLKIYLFGKFVRCFMYKKTIFHFDKNSTTRSENQSKINFEWAGRNDERAAEGGKANLRKGGRV